MKIKTPFFIIEIEILFFIILLVSLFSITFRNYLANYFICYFFIIFHELSHMFVGTIFGEEIELFKFSVSGVSIRFVEEKNNNINKVIRIIIYIAGPISNVVLALLFYKINLVFQINIFLAVVNLIPIYPLDGYNIIKNIILIFCNIKKVNYILKIMNISLCLVLLIIAIALVIISKNPSILIFLVYIFLLNKNNQKYSKFEEIKYNLLC